LKIEISDESSIYIDVTVTQALFNRLEGQEVFRDELLNKLLEIPCVLEADLDDSCIKLNVVPTLEMEHLRLEVENILAMYERMRLLL